MTEPIGGPPTAADYAWAKATSVAEALRELVTKVQEIDSRVAELERRSIAHETTHASEND